MTSSDSVTLRYNNDGSVDVLVGDWVYVHVNYDYRYTDNANRAWLANEIKRLLTTQPTP